MLQQNRPFDHKKNGSVTMKTSGNLKIKQMIVLTGVLLHFCVGCIVFTLIYPWALLNPSSSLVIFRPELVLVMTSVGNGVANTVWEAEIKGRTKPSSSSARYQN
jgi:hypothetical protein